MFAAWVGTVFAVLLASESSALGHDIRWQAAPGRGCSPPEALDAMVRERLQGSRDRSPAASVRVHLAQRANTWRATIVLSDAGIDQGERVLEVRSPDCSAIEQYATLAVALMLSAPLGDVRPSPADESAASRTSTGTPVPTRAFAPVEPRSVASPRLLGDGPLLGLVLSPPPFDPTLLTVSEQGQLATLVSEFQANLGRAMSAGRRLAVWLDDRRWESELQLYAWAWNVTRGITRAPRLSLPNRADKSVRLLVVPSLSQMKVQDGVRLEGPRQSFGVRASGTLRVSLFDLVRKRALAPAVVSDEIFYGGAQDARAVALRLLLGRLIQRATTALRAHEITGLAPRIAEASDVGGTIALGRIHGLENGDAFHFVNRAGAKSGYAVLHDVQSNRAAFDTVKWGQGSGLVEAAEYSEARSVLMLSATYRLAYQQPSSGQRTRAEQQGREPRQLGRALEYGILGRHIYSLAAHSPASWLWELGGGWAIGEFVAFNIEPRIGAGWRLARLPACGCELTAMLRVGGFLQLSKTAAIAETASTGAQLEVLRAPGDSSLVFELTTQLVHPFSVAGNFVDGQEPLLHGLMLGVGLVPRPSRYDAHASLPPRSASAK